MICTVHLLFLDLSPNPSLVVYPSPSKGTILLIEHSPPTSTILHILTQHRTLPPSKSSTESANVRPQNVRSFSHLSRLPLQSPRTLSYLHPANLNLQYQNTILILYQLTPPLLLVDALEIVAHSPNFKPH